jgi:hypothetical protein
MDKQQQQRHQQQHCCDTVASNTVGPGPILTPCCFCFWLPQQGGYKPVLRAQKNATSNQHPNLRTNKYAAP